MNLTKVVFTYKLTKKAEFFLKKHKINYIITDEFIKYNPEILVIRANTKIMKKEINKLNNLRLIITTTHGLDHIDIDYATKRGIQVIRISSCEISVAELVFGSLICLMRKICLINNELKKGNWIKPLGNELYGKILGIIALGKIGKKVAEIAKSFGMKVIYFDPYVDAPGKREIDELIYEAEIITIHAPAVPSLIGFFNYDLFMKMKGKILLNFSRGSLIKTQDLIKALENKILKGVVLDVHEVEPLSKDVAERFSKFDNVILLSHIGGNTEEGRKRADLMAAKKVCEYFK